jgi:hypothetical protein
MTDSEILSHVENCARALKDYPVRWKAPASIRRVTVKPVGRDGVVIWVFRSEGDDPSAYRLQARRVWANPETPALSLEAMHTEAGGGLMACSYWDLPGNVLDIASTMAMRELEISVRGWSA